MAGDVPAVASAVRLLERIARDWPEPVQAGTLIEELGLNRSTAYSILGTLQRAGWAATKGGRAGWSLGPRLLSIAPAAEDRIAAIVREELNLASRDLGFLAFAVQRNADGGYTAVYRAERPKGVHISVSIGDTFPFGAPAMMRAFHSWSEYGFDRELPAFTPESITDQDALREEMARTRDRGYGVSIREYDLAQSGITAPVFDAEGRVTLVLTALAFSSELNEKTVDRYGPILRDCALRITERTGGVWPRP